MIVVEPIFRHCRFVWVSHSHVPVVLLFSGLNGMASQSDVHLATLTGDAVHSRSPQIVLHRTEEVGDLPWQKVHTLDVC